jgi:hypothetical protein
MTSCAGAGETGTGKSVSVKKKVLEDFREEFLSIHVTFSAQTSANQTQDVIDSKLDRRRKGVLGPPVSWGKVPACERERGLSLLEPFVARLG